MKIFIIFAALMYISTIQAEATECERENMRIQEMRNKVIESLTNDEIPHSTGILFVSALSGAKNIGNREGSCAGLSTNLDSIELELNELYKNL